MSPTWPNAEKAGLQCLARVRVLPGYCRRLPRLSPASRLPTSVPPPACMPRAGNGATHYGLGVTEHSQGSTTVMGTLTSPWPPATSGARASA